MLFEEDHFARKGMKRTKVSRGCFLALDILIIDWKKLKTLCSHVYLNFTDLTIKKGNLTL